MTAKKLKDTGQRTIFNTGSQKEIVVGRGRYDLIPLQVIAELQKADIYYKGAKTEEEQVKLLPDYINYINKAMISENLENKQDLLLSAANLLIRDILNITVITAVQQLAILYEQGANKYAARDWEKGRPMEVFLNSALRHTYQFLNNETDENHGIQALWNIISCIDTIRRLPSCAYTLKEVTE